MISHGYGKKYPTEISETAFAFGVMRLG